MSLNSKSEEAHRLAHELTRHTESMTAALEAVRERLEADGDQLHRVFLNLARNAVEAGAHRLRFAAVLASPRGFEPCPFKTQQEPFAFA